MIKAEDLEPGGIYHGMEKSEIRQVIKILSKKLQYVDETPGRISNPKWMSNHDFIEWAYGVVA